MRRINGERFGRWSLYFDSAYCTALGAAIALFAKQIAEGIALPAPLIATTGAAVVVWAAGIVWMLTRLPLRRVLRLVMVANVLAAISVGFVSTVAATLFIVLVVVAIAVDVAGFAASQAIALRALPINR